MVHFDVGMHVALLSHVSNLFDYMCVMPLYSMFGRSRIVAPAKETQSSRNDRQHTRWKLALLPTSRAN